MTRLTILTFLFSIAGDYALAQSSEPRVVAPTATQPSSVEPYYPKQVYQPKRLKPKGKITYDARAKFYERKEQVAKANRKAEKELQKPQYSDPSYFGHKKPPKRNPRGKIKYCKECGIRH